MDLLDYETTWLSVPDEVNSSLSDLWPDLAGNLGSVIGLVDRYFRHAVWSGHLLYQECGLASDGLLGVVDLDSFNYSVVDSFLRGSWVSERDGESYYGLSFLGFSDALFFTSNNRY